MDNYENNDLGGRVYPEELQKVIYSLSLRLKARDLSHNTLQGLVPSQYMKFYVKAAGIIVEAAINLTVHSPGGERVKSFLSWIKTLTGFTIIPEDPLDEGTIFIEKKAEAPEIKTLEAGESHE